MKLELATADDKRRAALTLHALHADDRGWVLGQLAGPQRGELEALLAELAELGIPRDPELVKVALAAKKPESRRAPSASLQAEPRALAKLLAHEPDVIALHCLALLSAAQRAEVMALLMGDKRTRIESAQAPVQVAPALTAAIAKIVTAKLATHAANEVRP